jgi:hypothetical protein
VKITEQQNPKCEHKVVSRDERVAARFGLLKEKELTRRSNELGAAEVAPKRITGKVHHTDAKVGGSFKMSFTNFATGKSHSFGGEYLALIPRERIRYTDVFDGPESA